MKFGIVPSSEITSKSLLARDYMLDAKYEARKIIREWNRAHANIINVVNSPGGNALLAKIEQGLERAYELGQRRSPNPKEEP
jgi:hypothetical protein